MKKFIMLVFFPFAFMVTYFFVHYSSTHPLNEGLNWKEIKKENSHNTYTFEKIHSKKIAAQFPKHARLPAASKNTLPKRRGIFEDKKYDTWRINLATSLYQYKSKDTQIFIAHEQSTVFKGSPVEVVIISYLMKDNNMKSFSALIDSESGKMIHTWGSTIDDSLLFKNSATKRGSKAKLTPTKIIYSKNNRVEVKYVKRSSK